MAIKFYVNPQDINQIETPFFYLIDNRWDDFNNKTSYKLYYKPEKQGFVSLIGDLKIMHETEADTIKIIPNIFDELPEDFGSIGQYIGYYEKLRELFPKNYMEIIQNLNDIAFLDGSKDKFERSSGFKHSLIRFSEAEKAFYEIKNMFVGNPILEDFQFNYKCKIENAEDIHSVDFNFGDNPNLPNRIVSLIGKNGTGKTQFLANLALDLSGKSKSKLKENIFFPKRPLFSKVIAVSYSVFDKFPRPKSDKSFSYKYCGLKDESGRLLSGPKIVENYEASAKSIIQQSRGQHWYDVLCKIIGEELTDYYYEEIFIKDNYEIVNNNTHKLLSSGQSFLMYVITEVIANIKKNSLILFDEPEMHLHPNAIGNLIRMLEKILTQFKSYAVIATHSPIILQEIPSRYVNVFERQGNIPMIYKLGTESFGENIDVLTENVFKTIEVEDHYKNVLKNLSKEKPYKNVLSYFDNKLSLNAKTFLLNQYSDPEKELNA